MDKLTQSRLDFVQACIKITSFNEFIHDLSIKLTDAQVAVFTSQTGTTDLDLTKPADETSDEERRVVGAASAAAGSLATEQLQVQKPCLYQMTFSRVVDNFLSYISGLLFEIFVQKPETLRTKEKIDVTIALDFTEKEQLIHYLAEQKVNELAYKGITELSEYLDSTLGFPLVENKAELSEINRIVQIRNLIIHNRGIVNKRAADKCPSIGTGVGDEITLDVKAVLEAYDLFYEKAKADRKSTRLNSSHIPLSRMPSSA